MPIIKRHQTLLDFATQYTGSVEGIIQLCQLNDLSITGETPAGNMLLTGDVIENKNSFATTGIEISTGAFLLSGNVPSGIGYWYVSLDFKVS